MYTIRQIALAGTALATTSFALASFSTTLWHLYATFAIAGMYAIQNYCPLSKNAVSAFQISCNLLPFTLEDS